MTMTASPLGMIQPRGHGDFLAEIAGRIHQPHVSVTCLKPLQGVEGLIGAAVVDVDHLPVAQRIHPDMIVGEIPRRLPASLKTGTTTHRWRLAKGAIVGLENLGMLSDEAFSFTALSLVIFMNRLVARI